MCDECGCGHTTAIGEVTHFYKKPMVVVVKCDESLQNGDQVQIKGATSEFNVTVLGLRNDLEKEIEKAEAGQKVAFVTPEIARPGDKVWLVMRVVPEGGDQ